MILSSIKQAGTAPKHSIKLNVPRNATFLRNLSMNETAVQPEDSLQTWLLCFCNVEYAQRPEVDHNDYDEV